MSVHIYKDGAWQEAEAPQRHVDGAWENTDGYVYENGAWEQKWFKERKAYLIKDGVALVPYTIGYATNNIEERIDVYNQNGYLVVSCPALVGQTYERYGSVNFNYESIVPEGVEGGEVKCHIIYYVNFDNRLDLSYAESYGVGLTVSDYDGAVCTYVGENLNSKTLMDKAFTGVFYGSDVAYANIVWKTINDESPTYASQKEIYIKDFWIEF